MSPESGGWCDLCYSVCHLPHEFIDDIASAVHMRWRNWVELDDVRQELWVKFFENPRLMRSLIAGDEGRQGLARSVLARQGHLYCRREMHAKQHVADDQQTYSKRALRWLLPGVFGGDIVAERAIPVESVRASSAAPGELQTMWLDIKQALKQLPSEDRQILFDLYGGKPADQPRTWDGRYRRAQTVLGHLQTILNEGHEMAYT